MQKFTFVVITPPCADRTACPATILIYKTQIGGNTPLFFNRIDSQNEPSLPMSQLEYAKKVRWRDPHAFPMLSSSTLWRLLCSVLWIFSSYSYAMELNYFLFVVLGKISLLLDYYNWRMINNGDHSNRKIHYLCYHPKYCGPDCSLCILHPPEQCGADCFLCRGTNPLIRSRFH